jgi:hypothetical protein
VTDSAYKRPGIDPIVAAGVSTQRADDYARAERLAMRSTRPRRNRWKQLLEIDAELKQLQEAQSAAAARARELGEPFADALNADQRARADWLASGRRGSEPQPTAEAVRLEQEQARADVDAYTVAIEEKTEQRVRHISKHRKRMEREAARDVAEAHAAYVAWARQGQELRQNLLDAHADELWVQCFPQGCAAEEFGFRDVLALGLSKPIRETLGFNQQLRFDAVLAALERDADVIASAVTENQQAALGTPQKQSPERVAMFESDPEHQEWIKAQRQRLNEAAVYTAPADLAALGQELAD